MIGSVDLGENIQWRNAEDEEAASPPSHANTRGLIVKV